MVAKIIRGMCVSVAGTAFASLLQYALMSGEITWWVPLTGAGGAMALLILLESYRREISTEHVSSLTPAQRVEVEKIRREFWGENVVPALVISLMFLGLLSIILLTILAAAGLLD